MSSREIHPKWWQLYLSFPLLIMLFMLDHSLKLSVKWHQAVQIGFLLLVYGLIHLWLKANATALSKMDQSQFHGTVTVTRVPSHQLPETTNGIRPMFQIPSSEIKGTLSDTFEMDFIDADAFPVGNGPQELNKEQK